MGTDLKLDLTTHDLEELAVVTDGDEIVQHIKIRLLAYLGEWFLNTDLGTPYFQNILGQIFRPQNAAAIIRARILNTPEVDGISKFNFSLSNRNLSIYAEVNVGNTISIITINEDI